VLPYLVKEKSPRVKAALIGILANRVEKPAVPAMLECLRSGDYGLKLDTAWTLRFYGEDPRVPPALVEALANERELILGTVSGLGGSYNAATASLEAIGRTAVPALITAVRTGNKNQRIEALKALSSIACESASRGDCLDRNVLIAAGIKGLRDKDSSEVRANAAQLLEYLGTEAKAANDDLVRSLSDQWALVRVRAAAALARVSPENNLSVPCLIKEILNKSRMRCVAVYELIALDNPGSSQAPDRRIMPTLIKALNGHDELLQQAVLADFPTTWPDAKAAIPVLRKLAKGDSDRAASARQVLDDIESIHLR
jgi:HEAT repeat protein